MATETITLRLVAQDLMSGNVSKAIGKIDTLAKRGGIMGSVFQGIGQSIGQMLNPLGLATQGFGMMTDFLMDATKAAIEDEKAQARLVTTLKANVDGWESHADALDAAIEAGQELAFTDDDIRASLGRLLPFTKDVNEAIRLNAMAMDLARARGMGLEEAASLVAKAYSGQATALRRAGIAITNTKDSTKALAELQQQVFGQAEDYAETTEGTFQSLQIQLDEVVEQIGYELLPTVKDFAEYAKTDLVPAVKETVKNLKEAVDVMGLLGAVATMDPKVISKVIDWLNKTDEAAKGLTQTLSVPPPGAIQFFGTIEDAVPPVIKAMDDVGRMVISLPDKFTLAVVDMKNRIKEGKDGIIEQFRDLAWQTKHPFAEKSYSNWLAEKVEKAERKMRQAARRGKPGIVAQYRDLRDQIMIEMLTLPGNLARLQESINVILGRIYANVRNAVGNVFNLGGGGQMIETRATGGPVRAGRPYIVGEREPELFVPSTNGNILNSRQMAGLGGTVFVNVTHIGAMSEAEGDRLAAAIEKPLRRRMARSAA